MASRKREKRVREREVLMSMFMHACVSVVRCMTDVSVCCLRKPQVY